MRGSPKRIQESHVRRNIPEEVLLQMSQPHEHWRYITRRCGKSHLVYTGSCKTRPRLDASSRRRIWSNCSDAVSTSSPSFTTQRDDTCARWRYIVVSHEFSTTDTHTNARVHMTQLLLAIELIITPYYTRIKKNFSANIYHALFTNFSPVTRARLKDVQTVDDSLPSARK